MSRAKGTPDLRPQVVIQLREAAAAGASDDELAATYALPVRRVADIRTGATYARIGGPRTHRKSGRQPPPSAMRVQEGGR